MLRRLKSAALRAVFANALPPELFDNNISYESAKLLFKTYVDTIEIETHSYCNRICAFCPNVFIDRRSSNSILSDTVMKTICANLMDISFSGHIIFSGYNEPFYGKSVFRWAEALKAAAPLCRLLVISNGDYLNRKTLNQAAAVGISRITVDLYPAAGKENDTTEHERITRLLEDRSGLTLPRVTSGFMETNFESISIGVRVCNYKPKDLQTRGGMVSIPEKAGYVRTAPCFFPINQVTINHTGDGMLCCQVRSDVREHRNSIFSNLNDDGEDLFTYYRALATARKHLVTGKAKGGVCRNCDFLDATPEWAARRPGVSLASRLVPGSIMLALLERRRRKRSSPFH